MMHPTETDFSASQSILPLPRILYLVHRTATFLLK